MRVSMLISIFFFLLSSVTFAEDGFYSENDLREFSTAGIQDVTEGSKINVTKSFLINRDSCQLIKTRVIENAKCTLCTQTEPGPLNVSPVKTVADQVKIEGDKPKETKIYFKGLNKVGLVLTCPMFGNISLYTYINQLKSEGIEIVVKKFKEAKLKAPGTPGSSDGGGAVTKKEKKSDRVPANH